MGKEVNMIIDNLVNSIMSDKNDDIEMIIEEELNYREVIMYEVKEIIKRASKEIIVPIYLDTVDEYMKNLLT